MTARWSPIDRRIRATVRGIELVRVNAQPGGKYGAPAPAPAMTDVDNPRNVPRGPKPRGICPACGQERAVLVDGVMGGHGAWDEHCPGVGLRPLRLVETP